MAASTTITTIHMFYIQGYISTKGEILTFSRWRPLSYRNQSIDLQRPQLLEGVAGKEGDDVFQGCAIFI